MPGQYQLFNKLTNDLDILYVALIRIIKILSGVFPADGCFLVYPEVEIFRMEGEALILTFPMFQRVLKVRNIASPTATYLITKGNSTGAYEGEGRVHRHDRQLWLLPAQASDSGEYTCTYRYLLHASWYSTPFVFFPLLCWTAFADGDLEKQVTIQIFFFSWLVVFFFISLASTQSQ